jgi:hypothetical protein
MVEVGVPVAVSVGEGVKEITSDGEGEGVTVAVEVPEGVIVAL